MQDGQKNGLCHFSSQHSAIGVVKEGDSCYLEYRKNGICTKLWLSFINDSTWKFDAGYFCTPGIGGIFKKISF